ncbi:MAG TPA: CHAT domain-containing protein [Thermoanaerobaculia bacterium]|nr:CHAT domain-containing protein [Thermoanaerobaculia bacterium]
MTKSACPPTEILAMFADGRIPRSEVAPLVAHIDECEDCMATLEAANETLATVRTPFRARWWMAAAAALIAGVVSLFVINQLRARSPMDRLVRLMPAGIRLSEARLSGGFAWAAYRGPMRAENADDDPQHMQLIGAAGEIVANADRDHSADAQQAAGVALVVTDRPLQAVARLRTAVQASPNDAAAWSDLAAAQYAAALRLSRPSLLPEALVSADRALRIDARSPEARFNRALILERLGLAQEARAAWQHYLEVDSSSPWAAEARDRMKKIEQGADNRGAPDAQRTRAYAEVETLGRWAESNSAHELSSARTIGDALIRRSGESLLREAVRAIDDATPSQRAILAEAHAAYRRGRIAYSRNQLDVARTELARAAEGFEEGGSPMRFVARYYAANVRFDQNDVDGASHALEVLLGELHPSYIALAAQVRWELALCLMVEGDWSGALPLLEASRDGFRRLEEHNHHGFLESLVADALLSLGRPDEAWSARTRAFALLSADGRGDRLPVCMQAAVQMELRSGRLETARALMDVERSAGRAIASDFVAADALIRSALINTRIGDVEAARASLREAEAASVRVADPSMRELARAHVQLATAAGLVSSDSARAENLLGHAIELYRASDRTVFLPECHLLRARAELHRGDRDAAARDLDEGVAMLERSRVRVGGVVGTGVLDAGEALFDEAIRLSLDRSDVSAALAYSERSRTQLRNDGIVTVPQLQTRLGTSGAAILQLIALPNELVAICVTARDAQVKRQPLAREAIESLVKREALAEWYDLAIRPFDAMLAGARELIVVADRPMDAVPFAALYNSATHQYLVQRMPVSRAMSASALHPSTVDAEKGSLLAVALPSGEANAGLPETSREVAGIARLYPNAVTIEDASFAAFNDAAPRANVIHIAGHTQRTTGDAGSALVFARERVTWSAIASHALPRAPIVVLAACESLALGHGFLAAGATDVIGTLTPVADADARELFQSIHHHLAAGAIPAVAVQQAQLEALARHSSAWRAVTSLTRSIPKGERT